MTTIHRAKFMGPSHFRILDAEDLKKAGVEGFRKTSFPKRVEVEVDEKVASALTGHPSLFGRFEKDTIEREEVAPEPEPETPAEPEALTLEEANDSGTGSAAIQTDSPSTGSTTRKASKSLT